MREIVNFLRANPQELVLLVICIVLGVGTFLAVIFGLVSSGPGTSGGEPSGSVAVFHAALSGLPGIGR